MELVSKIVKQFGVWLPLLIVLGVVALAVFFISKMFKGVGKVVETLNPANLFESEEEKQTKKSVEDAQKKEAESSKALRKLTESQAQLIADNIKNALIGGWFSEDEKTIIENVQKIQNQGDYDLVSAKYGYVKNWSWFSSPMTMIQHMRDLLGGSDLKTIEDWFKSHKISV
jgi:Sec-independent protein translocase protein TatA